MKKQITQKKRGRKPITDKKRPVTIFVRSSQIEKVGGDDNLKNLLKKIIDNAMGTI